MQGGMSFLASKFVFGGGIVGSDKERQACKAVCVTTVCMEFSVRRARKSKVIGRMLKRASHIIHFSCSSGCMLL